MYTRIFNYFTNAAQSARAGRWMHHWRTWSWALRVRLTKEMSADVAQGAGLRKHRCKFEGIKRRSSGSRCALCASSVRHTRSHDRSRYARQFCRISPPHCVCNFTKLRLHPCVVSSCPRRNFLTSWTLLLRGSAQLAGESQFCTFTLFFFSLTRISLLHSRVKSSRKC